MSSIPWHRSHRAACLVPTAVALAVADGHPALARALDRCGTGLRVARQCASVTELLSVSITRQVHLAVLDTALAELDRTVPERLRRAGVGGVLLVGPGEGDWGQPGWTVLPRGCPEAAVVRELQEVARAERGRDGVGKVGGGGSGVGAAGALVAVWGPHGAPGRTTVAAALAHALAQRGGSILVDADVQAPSLNQVLGLGEQPASVATAARLASRSTLDQEALAALLVPVGPGERVLGGVGRAGRWRELPPVAMEHVWELSRHLAAWTVVDVAGGEVEEEVDSYTLEPGRGALVASLLRQADVIVVVGQADAVVMRRLTQLLTGLRQMEAVRGRLQVVVNRVRTASAGPDPARAVRRVLADRVGSEELVLLPEGPQVDRALRHGRSVLEDDADSPLGLALTGLVNHLAPAACDPAPACPGRGPCRSRAVLAWLTWRTRSLT